MRPVSSVRHCSGLFVLFFTFWFCFLVLFFVFSCKGKKKKSLYLGKTTFFLLKRKIKDIEVFLVLLKLRSR